MRRILAVGLVLLVPAVAYAQTIDGPVKGPVQRYAVLESHVQKKALPPLKLPDINGQVRRLESANRNTAVSQLAASTRVLTFWANHRWLLAPRHTKCFEVPWQRSCTVARASQRLHLKLAAVAQHKIDREIPLINDWLTAVRWVQKIYPGTESWMLAISDREGGWGRPVWYSGACSNPPCYWQGYHVGNDYLGADTVFGAMQFRFSTFAPYWRAAVMNLRQRGYIVPNIPMPPEGGDPKYAAWLSPLGQALTAGYMKYYGREGCHWCL